MIELPKDVWRWLAENARDLARIAKAMEKIAEDEDSPRGEAALREIERRMKRIKNRRNRG